MQNVWRPGANAELISRYDYASDDLGRRSSVVNSGSAFGGTGNERLTLWDYNARNELTTANRHLGTDPETPGDAVPEEQFSYTYDALGNRVTYTAGTLPTATYTRNGLNQYTRTNLPTSPPLMQSCEYDADGNLTNLWLAGDMNCDGLVNMNDVNAFVTAATSCAQYEQAWPNCNCLNADINGDGMVSQADINPFVTLLSGGGNSGLSQTYVWDAENRLVEYRPTFPAQVSNPQKLTFQYDYLGRRVGKTVYNWAGTDWATSAAEDRKFVWHGWKLLAEYDCAGGGCGTAVPPVTKYTWGLDLAGQMGGAGVSPADLESAGGIGGVLATEHPTEANPVSYVYLYDGNGNVTQVVDPSATGLATVVQVHYEYDPYGNRVNAPRTGEFEQPFRFSTKAFEAAPGLYYYGYRWYSPGLGRWLSRDPLGIRDKK